METHSHPYAVAARDPRTPLTELQRLAADYPELRPLIAANPSTYPDLLQWLGSLGDPQVDAALARRNSYPATGLGAVGGIPAGAAAPATTPTRIVPATPTRVATSAPARTAPSQLLSSRLAAAPVAQPQPAQARLAPATPSPAAERERGQKPIWIIALFLLLAALIFFIWFFVFGRVDKTPSAAPTVTGTGPAVSTAPGGDPTGGASGQGTADPGGDPSGDPTGDPTADPIGSVPLTAEHVTQTVRNLGCGDGEGTANLLIQYAAHAEQPGSSLTGSPEEETILSLITEIEDRCGSEYRFQVTNRLFYQHDLPELSALIGHNPQIGVLLESEGGFMSPSGNIRCDYYADGARTVSCVIYQSNSGANLEFFLEEPAFSADETHYSYRRAPGRPPTQQYGWNDVWRGTQCSVASTGVKCSNSEGRSFHLSRANSGYEVDNG